MAGASQPPLTIANYLSNENLNRLQRIGYEFHELLGKGGNGAAFRCELTTTDDQGNRVVKQQAVKAMSIKYTPDFRRRTPEEVEDLTRFNDLRINYRIKGKVIKEKIKWRRVDESAYQHLTENPMSRRKDTEVRRRLDIIHTELHAMTTANHPNVVKLENMVSFYDEHPGNPYFASVLIFLELAESDLFDHLRNTPHNETQTKQMMAQIGRGVAHLHERGIAHKDLKPENILVHRDQQQNVVLKIADFGLAMMFNPDDTPTCADTRVTELYVSPEVTRQWAEVQRGARNELSYDPTKVDMWGLVVILCVIMFGINSVARVHRNLAPNASVSAAFLNFLSTQRVTPELDNLLKSLFVDEDHIRIDITQFCDHQWIRDAIIDDRRVRPSFSMPTQQ